MKKVSVYIPTHNRPNFLKRALDSLASQDYKEFQVLVCDDGSRKENKKKVISIIKEYKDKFDDLVFFDELEPKGACHARNIMINAADGEYITGLDDDDEFASDRLRMFIESDLIHNYAYLSSGRIVNDGKAPFKSIEIKGEISLEDMLYANVAGTQIFTRTEYLRKIGGFDISFPSWQDYDIWLRLTKEIGGGYKIPEYNYILNIDHEMGRITNSQKVTEGYLKFIEKHSAILERKHLKSLTVQNIINSMSPLTVKDITKNLDTNTLNPIFKYWIKEHWPSLFVFIRSLARPINSRP
ncbi:glycosyltransferase [Halomonas sp. WWR20]